MCVSTTILPTLSSDPIFRYLPEDMETKTEAILDEMEVSS